MGFLDNFIGRAIYNEYQENKKEKIKIHYRNINRFLALKNGDIISISSKDMIDGFTKRVINRGNSEYKSLSTYDLLIMFRLYRNVFVSEITNTTPFVYEYGISYIGSSFFINKNLGYEAVDEKEFVDYVIMMEKHLFMLRKEITPELVQEFDAMVEPFSKTVQVLKSLL